MKRAFAVFSMLLLAGAGCSVLPPAEETSSIIGSWNFVGVTYAGEVEEDISDIAATATFDASGQFSAVICNSMSGAYSISDNEVTVPEITSTLKFCTGVPGDVEAAFTPDLSAGMTFRAVGNELALVGDSGTSFRLERGAVGGDESAAGTITNVNLDQIALDGPAVITIETDAGIEEIQVPSFGFLLCEGGENIADVYALKQGDRVEVRGTVGEDGAIVPCESVEHYLRVVAE